jgi:hypothetical protein
LGATDAPNQIFTVFYSDYASLGNSATQRGRAPSRRGKGAALIGPPEPNKKTHRLSGGFRSLPARQKLVVEIARRLLLIQLCAMLEKLYEPVNQATFPADHMQPALMPMLVQHFAQILLQVSHHGPPQQIQQPWSFDSSMTQVFLPGQHAAFRRGSTDILSNSLMLGRAAGDEKQEIPIHAIEKYDAIVAALSLQQPLLGSCC